MSTMKSPDDAILPGTQCVARARAHMAGRKAEHDGREGSIAERAAGEGEQNAEEAQIGAECN
jgi:hypothetical protein